MLLPKLPAQEAPSENRWFQNTSLDRPCLDPSCIPRSSGTLARSLNLWGLSLPTSKHLSSGMPGPWHLSSGGRVAAQGLPPPLGTPPRTPVCNLTPKCPLVRTDLRVVKSTCPSSGCSNQTPSTGRLTLHRPHSSVLEAGRLAPSCRCLGDPLPGPQMAIVSLCPRGGGGGGAGWGLFSKGAAPTHTGSPLMAQPTPKPSLPTAITWR